jgi:hypothetical protein
VLRGFGDILETPRVQGEVCFNFATYYPEGVLRCEPL